MLSFNVEKRRCIYLRDHAFVITFFHITPVKCTRVSQDAHTRGAQATSVPLSLIHYAQLLTY